MVAIIDYGMGNVASVQKALSFLKVENFITADPDLIENSDAIILPGVGSFQKGIHNLRESCLADVLTYQVIDRKKKFLGICLGMQLLAENGNEPVPCLGLGWIKGEVKKFEFSDLRVPHMGWNNIEIVNDTYFNTGGNKDFYFIHSYHMVPEDENVISATVDYGIKVVAAIQKENIFATQFHPEKSQTSGLTVLESFLKSNA
jgi:glutamine amidotransferase